MNTIHWNKFDKCKTFVMYNYMILLTKVKEDLNWRFSTRAECSHYGTVGSVETFLVVTVWGECYWHLMSGGWS